MISTRWASNCELCVQDYGPAAVDPHETVRRRAQEALEKIAVRS